MIKIVEFEQRSAATGEVRRLIVSGDGPFIVSMGCFVDSPPPPGFRPCHECSTKTVHALEPVDIEVSSDFWKGRTGAIHVWIKDATGATRELSLRVDPEEDAARTGSSAGVKS